VSGAPIESREVFRGNLIRVAVEQWPEHEREVVRHPGAVAVAAITAGGDAVLVRQVREALRARILEVPAGLLDRDGESPESAARRELEEESGYRASAWRPVARVYSSPGFTDEVVHLFVAEHAERVGDPEDGIDVETIPLDDVPRAIADGRLVDAKSVVALLLALRER
jgi:ADP-ribose pyrophosphatase